MTIEASLRSMIAEIVREEIDRRTIRSEFVTVAEYARRRMLSPSTVRAAIREGRLPSNRIGRALRIPGDAEIGPHPQDAKRTARLAQLLGGTRR